MTVLREGTIVRERWTLERKIGRGATATVWAARHRNGDRVAIKALHPDLASDPSIRQRFLREAYVANAIGHPAVVRVVDDDVTPDGAPFLVMDLIEGETLEARRERAGGKLPVDEVVDYLSQLLSALEAAHLKQVIHRDIKPENLILQADGRLRILDFGLARLLDGAEAMTRTGALLGTPQFMSPEQAAGRIDTLDGRTDLWSVGASAFLLLAGVGVHQADTLPEMVNALLSKAPRSLGAVAPDIPADVARVIDGALVRDREKRWPTAKAMRDALLSACPRAHHASDEDAAIAGTVASTDFPPERDATTHEMPRVRPPPDPETSTLEMPAARAPRVPDGLTPLTPQPRTLVMPSAGKLPARGRPIPPALPGRRSRALLLFGLACVVLLAVMGIVMAWK